MRRPPRQLDTHRQSKTHGSFVESTINSNTKSCFVYPPDTQRRCERAPHTISRRTISEHFPKAAKRGIRRGQQPLSVIAPPLPPRREPPSEEDQHNNNPESSRQFLQTGSVPPPLALGSCSSPLMPMTASVSGNAGTEFPTRWGSICTAGSRLRGEHETTKTGTRGR